MSDNARPFPPGFPRLFLIETSHQQLPPPHPLSPLYTDLVHTLEGRDRLAVVLIEGVGDDIAVLELDGAVGGLLEAEGVLHPVNVITVRVVLTGVGTTGLFPGEGGLDSLGTIGKHTRSVYSSTQSWGEYRLWRKHIRASEEVSEFKSLGKIGVPDHATVANANLMVGLVNLPDLVDTVLQALFRPEDRDISLHGPLHSLADLGGGTGSAGGPDLVEVLDLLGTVVGGDGLEGLAGGSLVTDGVGDGSSEDDEIEQGVGTETVSTVDGHASSFTASVETGDDLVVALSIDGEDLTGVPRGDTTHVVVDGGKDGDGFLSDVDTLEVPGGLGDTGETGSENLRRKMAELEVDVILEGTDTTALTDLHGHGSGDDVTTGKILGRGGISLHESLTLRVQEVTTLTTRTFGDEETGTVDTSGVELDELHVLVGETSTGDHGHTVTGTRVGRSAAEVGSAVTTGGENSVVASEPVEGAVLKAVGENTTALSVLHEEIDGEVLNEVLHVVELQALSEEGIKKGLASSVGGGASSVGLSTLAVLLGLTTEGTLVTNNAETR